MVGCSYFVHFCRGGLSGCVGVQYFVSSLALQICRCMHGRRGETGFPEPPPQKKNTKIGGFSNTGPDFLENHYQTSIQCRTIIGMPAKRTDDDPLLVLFGSPYQLKKKKKKKKNVSKAEPPLKKLSGFACALGKRELVEALLYLPFDVMLLLVFCSSSTQYSVLVCGV